ncbi:MAG: antibiotic biosynthesis monooxygenase [Dehalococcoidia bacterium]
MATKILIERKVKADRLADFLELSLQLRAMAMRHSGYISGETLASTEDESRRLIISTWHSPGDWKEWENDPERQKIVKQMENFLEEKPIVRTFTEIWPPGI